jgi:hypothetical protein
MKCRQPLFTAQESTRPKRARAYCDS